MTTCLGKSCSYGIPSVYFVNFVSLCVCASFPFGFEDGVWDLITLKFLIIASLLTFHNILHHKSQYSSFYYKCHNVLLAR